MAYNYDYPYADVSRPNADWLLTQVKELNEKVIELVDIVEGFDIDKETVEKMIEQAIKVANAYTDSALDAYNMERMRPYVISMLENLEITLRNYINTQDENYYGAAIHQMEAYYQDTITYIDNKVVEILDMANPITGEIQTIPEVIDYIVEQFHRSAALTAGEYDGYELTANDYDSQLITAFDYDFNGSNVVVH